MINEIILDKIKFAELMPGARLKSLPDRFRRSLENPTESNLPIEKRYSVGEQLSVEGESYRIKDFQIYPQTDLEFLTNKVKGYHHYNCTSPITFTERLIFVLLEKI